MRKQEGLLLEQLLILERIHQVYYKVALVLKILFRQDKP